MSSKTKLWKSSQSTSRSRSRSSSVSCSSTSHISNSDEDSKDKSSFAKVRKYYDKKFSSLKREMFLEAEESASIRESSNIKLILSQFNSSLIEDLGSVVKMLEIVKTRRAKAFDEEDFAD